MQQHASIRTQVLVVKIKREISVATLLLSPHPNPPPHAGEGRGGGGPGPPSPRCRREALRLHIEQPLTRIAGEGADPRIKSGGDG